ncbi:MAG: metal-dependent hydrolase [Balneolaceae bacterium]|nr:MAG: metal-dependent hydrolase [Balneolaceae bacterium]
MDPLTHGLVGATASSTIANKEKLRPAAATGFIAAMLADLDYYIHIPSDPLFNIEIHRQFTHSFIFIPVGALIAAALLWLLVRKHLSFKETYLYSLAAYATSGIMDAFTSYGTQLLWPFSDTRFAWNIISVLDPLLTIGLLTLTVICVWKKRQALVWFSWAWLILILAYGWVQKERAETAAVSLAESRGHTVDDLVVKPTIGNQLLWRANYIYDDLIFTDAIRTGWIRGVAIYEGESAPLVNIEDEFSRFENTTLFADLQRFSRLSEGYMVRHPDEPMVIGDARYSMLPTTMVPLWGVEADTTRADEHLPFLYFRDASEEIREPFLEMLLGR